MAFSDEFCNGSTASAPVCAFRDTPNQCGSSGCSTFRRASLRSAVDVDGGMLRRSSRRSSVPGYGLSQARRKSIPAPPKPSDNAMLLQRITSSVHQLWVVSMTLCMAMKRNVSKVYDAMTDGSFRMHKQMKRWVVDNASLLSVCVLCSLASLVVFAMAFDIMENGDVSPAQSTPPSSCASMPKRVLLMTFAFAAGGLLALDHPMKVFIMSSM